MQSATRVTASTLGIYAGLLGMQHGIFEILQGDAAPDGVMINAIGTPCQAETVWHACLPAMTVIPNFVVTGILAVIVGLITAGWAAAFVQKKRGGPALMLLSITLLFVGGGFVPAFVGVVAGVAATGINAPLTGWRARLTDRPLRLLATLWPWTLVALVAWLPGAWILGYLFDQAMLELGFVLFFSFDLGLPILSVLAGLAQDISKTGGTSR